MGHGEGGQIEPVIHRGCRAAIYTRYPTCTETERHLADHGEESTILHVMHVGVSMEEE